MNDEGYPAYEMTVPAQADAGVELRKGPSGFGRKPDDAKNDEDVAKKGNTSGVSPHEG